MASIDSQALAAVTVLDAVDGETFRREVAPHDRPVVLRGLVSRWPLVQHAAGPPDALCDYVAGFGRDVPVEAFFGRPQIDGRFFYSDNLKGFNFARRTLPLAELLRTLLEIRDEPEPPAIYAGAIPLRNELAALLADNEFELLEPGTERLASIWIDNRGRTAAHWDLPKNVACVAAGRRRFTLFPPDQLANLYIGPVDLTLAGQPISLVDFHEPDFERFPRFRQALAAAQVAELGPGDAIFIPSMWFHHVESLDTLGMLVNFWWRDAEQYMYTPLFTLMHALLSIRDMPEIEREHWRRIFDHYIFRTGGEPMEHIPEDARGFFGELTPERINRLRAVLLDGLDGQPRQR